jgi:thiol-disulfide isomerase/thioredoxin
MTPLGTEGPPFALPDLDGQVVSMGTFADSPGLLVMFICPHCPFVQHLRAGIAEFAKEYQGRALAVVAINSNDVEQYPDDSPEGMAREVQEAGYTFPYLFDESQEVALAYGAACTPDFFLLDGDRRLVYRGQFDPSRPGNDVPVTGGDLRAACSALLEGRAIAQDQFPSLGCNIKWKPGNEPEYAT